MSKKMLINAIYPEECRVAVTQKGQLLELEVERHDQVQLKGNIYRAPISRIEPSLQAAFLDIGSSRNGFLQINDINPACFFEPQRKSNGGRRGHPSVKDILRQGQELVVQVVKDERAAKGATLTTNLSIPGRYLVLMIGNQRGGVSRKIQDEGQRKRLKASLDALSMPSGMGVIVRTAGINKSTIELQKDLDALLELWFQILEKNLTPGPSPVALYEESSLAIRTIRDYLLPDIEEILIDDKKTFDEVQSFISRTAATFDTKVTYYDKPTPLFSYFHLDSQVDTTNQSEVTLPSGGSIVINTTEAIVAIDVNSGRATGQSDVENTAFETNKEAAIEVARQLRLRDLGGLVVIDFIDMNDKRHKSTVEKVLKDAVRYDKAKVEIGRLSKFGLLEMSRQRLKSALVSHSHESCSHCQGRGKVRSPESVSLEALRKVQTAIYAGGISEVRLQISPVAGLMLLNTKRKDLNLFETETGASIRIYPDGRLRPEEYHIEIVRARHETPVVVHNAKDSVTTPSRGGERGRSARDNETGGNQGRSGGRGRNQRRNSDSNNRRRNNNRRRDRAPEERRNLEGARTDQNPATEKPVSNNGSDSASKSEVPRHDATATTRSQPEPI
ncbi:MAG TPA: Rne/Rng family ribonuclease [Oligoflexia bacterium]|nr:Rne/Rng family ribonuclease [Oligoflexia bacterium]HMP49769.1 Rne/Rng family ribonuclease [Oligoflexia bacterium]